jgi:hypothetical protein
MNEKIIECDGNYVVVVLRMALHLRISLSHPKKKED